MFRLVKYLKKHNYGFVNAPVIPVKLASLGYDSGKFGAASLIFEDYE